MLLCTKENVVFFTHRKAFTRRMHNSCVPKCAFDIMGINMIWHWLYFLSVRDVLNGLSYVVHAIMLLVNHVSTSILFRTSKSCVTEYARF